jgi:hypothetical protein
VKCKINDIEGIVGPTGGQGSPGSTGLSSEPLFLFSSASVNIASGDIINNGFITNTSEEFNGAITIQETYVLYNLRIELTSIPGFGNSRTFTVRVDGVDTALSVTITGLSTVATNTIDQINVSPGNQISLRTTSTGTPIASTCRGSVAYVNP